MAGACVVCVFLCVFWLYPTSTGWGLRCVCSGTDFGHILPNLARMLRFLCLSALCNVPHHSSLGVRVLVFGCGFSASPRHSWLGCRVCAFMYGLYHSSLGFLLYVFVFVFWLQPANPGWGVGSVCLATRFFCICHSSLGLLVCVVWYSFWLQPTNPGRGVLFLFLTAGSGLKPPILAGGWNVEFYVRSLHVPGQSWLGCAICLLGCGFWLQLANPGLAVVCVFSYVCATCTPRILTGVCGGVFGFGFWLQRTNSRWRVGFVCLPADSGVIPPNLAGRWEVEFCVRFLHVPSISWVWWVVCAFRCRF